MPAPDYKVALLTAAYVPDDAHDEFSDVQANEIAGTGYTAGGKLLAGVTVEFETETDVVLLACDDAVWEDADFAASYGFVYRSDTGKGVKLIDFGFEVPVVDGGSFTLENPLDLTLAFGLQAPSLQIDSVTLPDSLTLSASLHDPLVIVSEVPTTLAAAMTLLEPTAYSDATQFPASFAVQAEFAEPVIDIDSENIGGAITGGIGIEIQAPTIDIQNDLIPTPGRIQAGATQRTPTIQTFDARPVMTARATLREPEIWLGTLYPGVQQVRATLHAPSLVMSVSRSPGQMGQTLSGNVWSDANNAKLDDGNLAYSNNVVAGDTKLLTASNFGFSIPSGATIVGVVLTIKRKAQSAASAVDVNVHIQNGPSSPGTDLADTGTAWPTTLTEKEYGDPTELWGFALTPEIVNSSQFGASLRVNQVGATHIVYVDHIEITVYYRT